MKLLALETATAAGAVALLVDGHIVGEVVATDDRRHAETLIPTAQALLEAAEMTPQDLDAIVLDIGPGLFTGLRVGVATARSLAFSCSLPIYCVSSLEVLANDPSTQACRSIMSVVDARRGEVFVQGFERSQGAVRQLSDEAQVVKPEIFCEQLLNSSEPLILVGDGAQRYRSMFEEIDDVAFSATVIPSPGVAGLIIEKGRHLAFENPALVMPLYLRDPDAVANFSVAAAFRKP